MHIPDNPKLSISTYYDISYSDGVVTFKNINTTLGFVRYTDQAEVEYIFVNPFFRRKGLGRKLLSIVEKKTNNKQNKKRETKI